jgi:hypothetical protein
MLVQTRFGLHKHENDAKVPLLHQRPGTAARSSLPGLPLAEPSHLLTKIKWEMEIASSGKRFRWLMLVRSEASLVRFTIAFASEHALVCRVSRFH